MIRALKSPLVNSLAVSGGSRTMGSFAGSRREVAAVALSQDIVGVTAAEKARDSHSGLLGKGERGAVPTEPAKAPTEPAKVLAEPAKTCTISRVTDLSQLAKSDSITELKLSNIHLKDEALAHLARVPTVKTLDLSYNQISNLGLAAVVQHLPRLERVDLTEAGALSIYGLRALRSAAKLRDLRLGGPTMVTDANVHELNGVLPPQLEKLDLHGGARLSDAAIPHLLKLPHLQEFQLFGSGLSAAGKKGLMTALGFGSDGKRTA